MVVRSIRVGEHAGVAERVRQHPREQIVEPHAAKRRTPVLVCPPIESRPQLVERSFRPAPRVQVSAEHDGAIGWELIEQRPDLTREQRLSAATSAADPRDFRGAR